MDSTCVKDTVATRQRCTVGNSRHAGVGDSTWLDWELPRKLIKHTSGCDCEDVSRNSWHAIMKWCRRLILKMGGGVWGTECLQKQSTVVLLTSMSLGWEWGINLQTASLWLRQYACLAQQRISIVCRVHSQVRLRRNFYLRNLYCTSGTVDASQQCGNF